jgi:hypothetical protein
MLNKDDIASFEANWRTTSTMEYLYSSEYIRTFYKLLREIGIELQNLRWYQQRSILDLARQIGIFPQTLEYLELGWATPDEFLRVIELDFEHQVA